jgi:hypothetical protein
VPLPLQLRRLDRFECSEALPGPSEPTRPMEKVV